MPLGQGDVLIDADQEVHLHHHVDVTGIAGRDRVRQELAVGDRDLAIVERDEPDRAEPDVADFAVVPVERHAVPDLERLIHQDDQPGDDGRDEILQREADRYRRGAPDREQHLLRRNDDAVSREQETDEVHPEAGERRDLLDRQPSIGEPLAQPFEATADEAHADHGQRQDDDRVRNSAGPEKFQQIARLFQPARHAQSSAVTSTAGCVAAGNAPSRDARQSSPGSARRRVRAHRAARADRSAGGKPPGDTASPSRPRAS